MGLFHRNPNEANFAGGSKNFVESLHMDSHDIHSFYWRDNREDFNTGSTITVHPGEEAIFEKNGEFLEQFKNGGPYTLNTENYPFIGRILNAMTGGVSTFNCRIHWFRTAEITCNWGTSSPILVSDPVYGINLMIAANGQFRLRMTDPMLFINSLAGNVPEYNSDTLYEQIGAQYMSVIQNTMQQILATSQQDIEMMLTQRPQIAQQINPVIAQQFEQYGFMLVNFSIEQMTVLNMEELQALKLQRGTRRAESLGDLDELNMQGDRYNQIQGMKILKNLSVNEGAGGIASAGAGIGVGMAAGSVMGDIARSVFAPMQSTQQPQMPTYQQGGSSRFGQPTQTEEPKEDPMEKLANLKKMLDAGLIEQAEYDSVKSEILKKMM